jgi:hypothetical protein
MRPTNTVTTSILPSEAGKTSALAIDGTNVPSITVPDLTTLPAADLMSASQKVWMLGRSAHNATVACFKEIMYRYDGRKSNRPTFATVQDAFASIGVHYDAARKLVYREMRKRELEAIALNLHSLPASTDTPTQTSIFNIGDQVTVPDGDGQVSHVHQTTGRIDIVLDETQSPVANVDPKHVTMLNGAPVIDGKPAKQKEYVLVAGQLLIDGTSGKKWIYADGKFSPTKMLTRSEVKEEAIARLKADREAARKRKEEEKKVRQEQAASKEAAKIKAGKAKREAVQAKREAKRAAAADKAAKAAANAKKRSKVSSAKSSATTAKTNLVKVARIGGTQEFGVFSESCSEYTTAKALTIGTRAVGEAERDRINAKSRAVHAGESGLDTAVIATPLVPTSNTVAEVPLG